MRKKSQRNIENLLQAIEKKIFSSCSIQAVHITQATKCRISDFDCRTHQINALKGEMLFHHEKADKKWYSHHKSFSYIFNCPLFKYLSLCLFYVPFLSFLGFDVVSFANERRRVSCCVFFLLLWDIILLAQQTNADRE